MRLLFFSVFCSVLALAILRLDWRELADEVGRNKNIRMIKGMLKADSTLAAPAAAHTIPGPDEEGTDPDWQEIQEPGKGIRGSSLADSLAHPQGMVPEPIEGVDPRFFDGAVPEPVEGESVEGEPVDRNAEFQDISNEPYLMESRRLLRQIQENYKKLEGAEQ